MVKCKVIKKFTLKDFDKLKNIVRGGIKNNHGELYINDTFECDEEMAEYLTGNNKNKDVVVKIIEVIPKVKKEEIIKEKPKKKKRNSKK